MSWQGTQGLVLKEDLLRSFEIPPPEKAALKCTQNGKMNKQI